MQQLPVWMHGEVVAYTTVDEDTYDWLKDLGFMGFGTEGMSTSDVWSSYPRSGLTFESTA